MLTGPQGCDTDYSELLSVFTGLEFKGSDTAQKGYKFTGLRRVIESGARYVTPCPISVEL